MTIIASKALAHRAGSRPVRRGNAVVSAALLPVVVRAASKDAAGCSRRRGHCKRSPAGTPAGGITHR